MSRFTPLGIGLALGVAGAAAMMPRAFAGSWTDPFILALRAPAKSTDRVGDLSLGAVIRTDERYGSDRLFQGPRGWDYWNRLENPKPDQDPNLWPDKRPSYRSVKWRCLREARLPSMAHSPMPAISMSRSTNSSGIPLSRWAVNLWTVGTSRRARDRVIRIAPGPIASSKIAVLRCIYWPRTHQE